MTDTLQPAWTVSVVLTKNEVGGLNVQHNVVNLRAASKEAATGKIVAEVMKKYPLHQVASVVTIEGLNND